MTQRTRIHNLHVSLDGYAAGTFITREKPFGDALELMAGFDGRFIHGMSDVDAPLTLERAMTTLWSQGIGAEIMGRGKFTPETGPWTDEGWRGWWGEEPPFSTPVFVMTHHPRESMEFANGTVFHFVSGPPAEVLDQAKGAAGGLDVRIGGGPTSVRSFLADDLVDVMHTVTVPVVLGEGTPLWDGLGGLQRRFSIEAVGSSDGVVHHLWNRWPRGVENASGEATPRTGGT
ncbi:dihydrofolate reductase family protein [Kytococcus sedentarius]|uniref:Dihydrofolate reductase n=1 Tax=Kytococcus sedentarius (strain ATCC 14392 / DSM 20547 / JCM 11482 / CCUG 33030 / NBRC 15357 / NCTC 11040 / CCM 314 / 541) TaxID=478801 RepID=C7NJF8_KYTSD|nr:dihydrofolate reductase family protein [Kytococcus sedentarius]ACV05288.1 dihydrofolate reductase [Kytococcus sedentarius DSM 20547]QQB63741.1 dihydrofolate reductase family protein [Kytococcus sedentarius]STX13304.1 RibD C-terminal domain [Kytococcus sedentarius]